ncbi:Coenzyme PQQ synthesis protein E [Minicystis rosea]|nr:Coenzyme PQQ synthesis protein E [Minicystis rosea]
MHPVVRLQLEARRLLQRDLHRPRFYARKARKQGLARAVTSFVQSKIPWALPLPRLPHVISLEPTSYCNLRCIMCPSPTLKGPRGHMAISIYEKILAEAAAFGVHRFRFVGLGEPTLNPRLPEMIRLAHRAGIYTELSTNGTLLTPALTEALLDAGLDEIGFSIDSIDEAEFERIRKGASFRAVMRNIDDFLARASLRDPRPITVARLVVMEGSDVEAFAREWRAKVDSLQFNMLRPYAKTELVRLGRAARPKPLERPVRCRQIRSYMLIGWDGRVGLCNQSSVVVGDVTKSSLEAIWKAHPLTTVRRLHARYEGRRIDVCRICPVMEPATSKGESPLEEAHVTERVAWSDAQISMPSNGGSLAK